MLRDSFLYVAIGVGGMLVGATLVGGAGLAIGMLLARGYQRRGPSDPGDAPVYVALGLGFFGACVGAIAGLMLAIALCIRSAQRKKQRPLA